MSYAWDRLHQAVIELTQEGPQRERLAAAITKHLFYLKPKELPAEVRSGFVALMNALPCGHSQPKDSWVHQWVATATEQDVKRLVESIIGMYDAVTRYEPIPAFVPAY